MRPPQNAGENIAARYAGRLVNTASMRPPQNAGENVSSLIPRRFALMRLQ